jgi:hypothetical protein
MSSRKGIRLAARRHEVREADLTGGKGDRRVRLQDVAVDPGPPPDRLVWLDGPAPRVRIGFTATWSAAVVGYTPAIVCPGCGDARLRPHEICVVCHQTRRSPRQWPMMAQGERARLLAGPPPLRPRVEQVRTRRQRRAVRCGM